ncbi:hypothetical protein, partial [Marinitoga sp. 38H-ov]|uniref:hypothetical protein n=1 Tax=Marinitoga sp. 38H-ov TaxID=1755814 RepID=UPI0013ECFEEB
MVSNILIKNLKIKNNSKNNIQKNVINNFTKNKAFSKIIDNINIRETTTHKTQSFNFNIKKLQLKIKDVKIYFSNERILSKNNIGKSLKIKKSYSIDSNLKEL